MIKLKKIRYNNKKKEPNMINLTINTLLIFCKSYTFFKVQEKERKEEEKRKYRRSSIMYAVAIRTRPP